MVSRLKLQARGTSRTSDTSDSFPSGKVGDVDESVVEGCVDVCNAEDEFTLRDLWAESDSNFLLGRLL